MQQYTILFPLHILKYTACYAVKLKLNPTGIGLYCKNAEKKSMFCSKRKSPTFLQLQLPQALKQDFISKRPFLKKK